MRLQAFEKSDDGDNFSDESLVVPLQYRWPFSATFKPSEIAANPARDFRDIVNKDVIEFGWVKPQGGSENPPFEPALYADDKGEYTETVCLTPGQTGRYYLEIISDQFTSRCPQVFSVYYDPDKSKPMKERITIKDVTQPRKQEGANGATR